MHDIKALRENTDMFIAAWSSRGNNATKPAQGEAEKNAHRLPSGVDGELRAAQTAFQTAQSRRNEASKLIGQAKAQKDEARAGELMAEVADLKSTIETAQETERAKTEELRDLLASLPNLPFDDVPLGKDEHGNVEQRRHGAPRSFGTFPPRITPISARLEDDGFRGGGENVRRALCRAERPAGTAGTRHRPVHA